MLSPEDFASRSVKINLACENGIANFVKKTDIEDKPKTFK